MTGPKVQLTITGSGEVRDSDGNLLNQEDSDEQEKEN